MITVCKIISWYMRNIMEHSSKLKESHLSSIKNIFLSKELFITTLVTKH